MRTVLALSSIILILSAPTAALAQQDSGAPAGPVPVDTNQAPTAEPTGPEPTGPEFSGFVGVGFGTNINGGSFGYELEVAGGVRYGIASIEVLAGTMSLHGGVEEVVGPHFGLMARLLFFENESGLGVQGGIGVRSHYWATGMVSDRAAGLVGGVRLYLPLTDFAVLRVDGEYERLFDDDMPKSERNIISLGVGLETRFHP